MSWLPLPSESGDALFGALNKESSDVSVCRSGREPQANGGLRRGGLGHLRERFLSLRVLEGYEAIVDACRLAWNAIADDAERIRSLRFHPYIQKVIG
jgi:hypothetical protein